METTITRARQVTIPARLLKRFGLSPGEKIKIVVLPEGILLIPKKRSFKAFAGSVKVRRWEDAEKAIEEEREKDLAR